MRKVRVLQIIDKLGPGGAEYLLVTLADGIDRSRFELHVCGLRPNPALPLAEVIRSHGVPVIELNQRNSYDLPAMLSIIRYIRRHKIDIIHTHLLASDIMGRVAGFLTRKPVLSTIHNSRTDLEAEAPHRQWMERITARFMARRLVVVSDLLRREIEEWFGLPPKRVVAIANGVDTERFRRAGNFDRVAVKRAMLGGDYPLVINVARLVPQKAQHHLIEAAEVVLASRPDVRFLLVGDGPSKEQLASQIEAAGLSDKILLTGHRTDVAELLAAGDVFVLSSLWEGLPVSLLEAMAAGCAAVATDVGGVAQVLEHGVTGLLAPPADPQALAGAILACVNDPQMAQRMGQAGQESATRQYGMRAWIGKLERLYLRELGL